MDDGEVAALYRRHVPALRGFTTVLTAGNTALAEDLVHDAFIRTAGRLTSLRDPAAVEAYLTRAIVNAYVRWRRRQSLERRWLSLQRGMAHSHDDAMSRVEGDDE